MRQPSDTMIFQQSLRRVICCCLLCMVVVAVSARCGATNYNLGSQALSDMCAMVIDIMSVVSGLLNVIAVLLGLYSATAIYIKLEMGEEGFTKSVAMLFGSFVFLLLESQIFPSFFGIQYVGGGYDYEETFLERVLNDLFGISI